MNDIQDNVRFIKSHRSIGELLRTDSSCSPHNTNNIDNDSIENNLYLPEDFHKQRNENEKIESIVDFIYNLIIDDVFSNELMIQRRLQQSRNSPLKHKILRDKSPQYYAVSSNAGESRSIFDERNDCSRLNDYLNSNYDEFANTPYSHLNVEFKSNEDDQGSDSNNSDEIMKNFLMLKEYEMNRKRKIKSKSDSKFICSFMECVFDKIITKSDLFLMAYSKPIKTDPFEELWKLRFNKSINPLLDSRTSVLTISLFNAISQYLIANDLRCVVCNREFQIDNDIESSDSRRNCFCYQIYSNDKLAILKESTFSHYKAIFDGINECINKSRPCGRKGEPMPWINERSLSTCYTKNVKRTVKEIHKQMLEINAIKAGPLSCTDCYNNEEFNEDYFSDIREKRLCNILTYDIKNEDNSIWLDCEWEEAQIKFDLADIIFDSLVEETVSIMEKI